MGTGCSDSWPDSRGQKSNLCKYLPVSYIGTPKTCITFIFTRKLCNYAKVHVLSLKTYFNHPLLHFISHITDLLYHWGAFFKISHLILGEKEFNSIIIDKELCFQLVAYHGHDWISRICKREAAFKISVFLA